jgi:hypothetical protein
VWGGSASRLHGNCYALTVTTRLGLGGKGGMVRIGAVHADEAYGSTVEERLGEGVEGWQD